MFIGVSLSGYKVSTHSRLKAAAFTLQYGLDWGGVSTHSRLKAAVEEAHSLPLATLFQHTAA